MGIKFTQQDEENIGSWMEEGISIRECAKRLGRTYEVVRRWSSRIGLQYDGVGARQSYAPWSKEDDLILLNGIRDGNTIKEIAGSMERGISACKNRIWKIRRDAKSKPQSLNAPKDYVAPDDMYGLWARANKTVRIRNERSR